MKFPALPNLTGPTFFKVTQLRDDSWKSFETPDPCRILAIGISFLYSHGLVVAHSSYGCQHTQAVLHRYSTHRTTTRRSLSTHSTRYQRRVEKSHYLTFIRILAFQHLLPSRSSPTVGILSFWWRIDYHFVWEPLDRFDWRDKWNISKVRTCCGFCAIQCKSDCWCSDWSSTQDEMWMFF